MLTRKAAQTSATKTMNPSKNPWIQILYLAYTEAVVIQSYVTQPVGLDP